MRDGEPTPLLDRLLRAAVSRRRAVALALVVAALFCRTVQPGNAPPNGQIGVVARLCRIRDPGISEWGEADSRFGARRLTPA